MAKTTQDWLRWNCNENFTPNELCQCEVGSTGMWTNASRCSRKHKHQVDGKYLCTLHYEMYLKDTKQLKSDTVIYYVTNQYQAINIFRVNVVNKPKSYIVIDTENIHSTSEKYKGGLYVSKLDKSDKCICLTYEDAIQKVDSIIEKRIEAIKNEAAMLNEFSEGLH